MNAMSLLVSLERDLGDLAEMTAVFVEEGEGEAIARLEVVDREGC